MVWPPDHGRQDAVNHASMPKAGSDWTPTRLSLCIDVQWNAPVVRDAQHGAGPLRNGVFERTQEVHIGIIRRLVQQEQVAILLENLQR